jgi:hypothetical protein
MIKKSSRATTASDTHASPESTTEALKRRKKQTRREAKLMLAIEAAKKAQKKAQKKQLKAQVSRRREAPHCTHLKHVWRNFAPKAPKLQQVQSQPLSWEKRPPHQRARWQSKMRPKGKQCRRTRLPLNVLLHQRLQGKQAHKRQRQREHRLRPNDQQVIANVPGSQPQMPSMKGSIQANRTQPCFHSILEELYGNY